MSRITKVLCALGLLVSSALAIDVVVVPTAMQWSGGSQYSDQNALGGAGIVTNADTIVHGAPVPATWPKHFSAQNSDPAISSIGFRTTDSPAATLTIDFDQTYNLTGIALWNFAAFFNGTWSNERGFGEVIIDYSTDGGSTWTTNAVTNTFTAATETLEIDAEVQSFASAITANKLRFNITNLGGNFTGLMEIRFTATPTPEAYYVAATPTDWTVPASWSDAQAARSGVNYYVTNNVVLNTPADPAVFPGLLLSLADSQRLDVMVSGAEVITIDDLRLDGATVAAGVVDAGEAKLDGNISVLSTSVFSGASDNSRDLRILSAIDGSGSLELTAPGHTVFIDNANNTFAGTWVVSDGTGVFTSASAVSDGNINVQNGTLRVLGGWDGYATGGSLTVSDSATAVVDLGSDAWTVASLTIGTNAVADSNTYTASELNALGDAVFTGSGTLQVGAPVLPQLLLHHWKFDEGTGTVAADSVGSNDGEIIGATWASDGVRSSYLSFNGTDNLVDPFLTNALQTVDNAETWACWVLNPASAANVSGIILGNRGASADDFCKLIARQGGRLAYRIGGATSNYDFSNGNVQIGTDVWTHLAFVRDGASATFYVDGVQVNDTPHTLNNIANAAPFAFSMGGESGRNATEFFGGGIDDVVIYNFALTSNNVVDVMNGIYEFGPIESPVLSIAPSSGSVIASWSEAGFKLQTRPDLVFGDWVDVPGATSSPVVVPATNNVEFLRLIQQ